MWLPAASACGVHLVSALGAIILAGSIIEYVSSTCVLPKEIRPSAELVPINKLRILLFKEAYAVPGGSDQRGGIRAADRLLLPETWLLVLRHRPDSEGQGSTDGG